jgi:ribosomal protein L37AE/L43A
MSKKTPVCSDCKTSVAGARTFIAGLWRCPDCTYVYEHGPAERVEPRQPRRRPQEERLFPLPPPVPKEDR